MRTDTWAVKEGHEIGRWDTFEWSATAKTSKPFDETVRAEFRLGSRSVHVAGFYAGGDEYRVRFLPDETGEWEFGISSSLPTLDGITGRLRCVVDATKHGPVRVADQFHFAHADGTRYLPIGTTCYAWVHQAEATQEATLSTLAASPFNKLRMCVFPKHYIYNQDEPAMHAFVQRGDGSLDFDRPNTRYFDHLERRIADLATLGIEADVILFHPYDRWGYAEMSATQDERYLRYVVARLAASPNVWWSVANEFDLMAKSAERWDQIIDVLRDADPHGHLLSIHNAERMYDHSRPEITHVCLQSWDVKRTREWRAAFGKPIVNDEPEYEGDIPLPWGNISPQELVHRFWITATNGGYAGHGETFLDPHDVLWWAKGGTLRGESAVRIGFLRSILEDAPSALEPMEPEWFLTRVSAVVADGYTLIYLGEHQPRIWFFGLPSDPGAYAIDLIDTWSMTITQLEPKPLAEMYRMPGAPDGSEPAFSLELPGRPFLALRIRRRDGGR